MDQKTINATVGLIVLGWSFVEHILDICISLIYHKCDGKTLIKEIPATRLNEKIKVFKKCLNQSPVLNLHKDEGLRLLDRVKILSKDRHNIIHGVMTTMSPYSLKLVKFKYGKEVHEIINIEYSISDLLEYGKKIQDLTSDFGNYARSLVNNFGI